MKPTITPWMPKIVRMSKSLVPIALRIAISRFFSSTTMMRVAITMKAATTMIDVKTTPSTTFWMASAVKRFWFSSAQSSVWNGPPS